jgi:hypothetical protein
MNAQVQIKDGHLIIALPIVKHASKTGKTTLVASTHGNHPAEGVVIDGKPVIISVNAYIR